MDLRDDLLQGIQDDAGGVQRGEGIHAILDGALTDGNAVIVVLAGGQGAGIEDVADVACPDRIQDLVAAIAELPADPGADAVFLQEPGSALGCLNVKAQAVEASGQRQASARVTITVPYSFILMPLA